ncbi:MULTISPECIES: helix-turn-helix domain-containing protein [unclassified Burkholderia]|uniref:winged helix-turn-helix transcriptional regulator n=1 Tax=unclassified Burkholderia TaxID=2613784 RepID=UPI001422965D|nr:MULTISPECIES: helix-turn-helix domain-containing protein [unclassified Burkholderia]NIE58493.1 helix-turn-helix transcriptional regulator [Burkholderia sp. Ap-955]NIF11156.1 helix-turn-helix transcriptional regulator [Burkholderia sp. Ax-1735]NIG03159.1 helix-turn-helix transcriptional regulator [Burkholderia sp. Tr-849]
MKTSATGCSVEEAMRLLGGRWRLLLVSYLLDGPRRFSDLRRDMPGISQRMLTLDLRALEDAGLVRRTVYPEVPVRVEYDLTADGDRLRPVVEVMREFGLWLKARDADASCDIDVTPGAAAAIDTALHSPR